MIKYKKINEEGSVLTKEYILNFLKSHKHELQDTYDITKIGLFGSYAKDSANENSDIDIAIESNKKDFFIREELKSYLELKFNLPVDVGYIDSFRNYYKTKIEKEIIYV